MYIKGNQYPLSQTSSLSGTISNTGLRPSAFFIAFRSSLVTRCGVTGMSGVKGWYGEYGTAPADQGVLRPAVLGPWWPGPCLSSTVVLVVGANEGDVMEGSKARNGSARFVAAVVEVFIGFGIGFCTFGVGKRGV